MAVLPDSWHLWVSSSCAIDQSQERRKPVVAGLERKRRAFAVASDPAAALESALHHTLCGMLIPATTSKPKQRVNSFSSGVWVSGDGEGPTLAFKRRNSRVQYLLQRELSRVWSQRTVPSRPRVVFSTVYTIDAQV